MRNSTVILVFLFTFCGLRSSATSQISDLLIYKGDTFHIYTNPLNQLLPIGAIDDSISNQLLNNCRMSNCAKGYRAIWEIKDDQQLYLIKIYDCCNPEIDLINILKPVVDEEYFAEQIFTYWFTGTLNAFPINGVHFEETYSHRFFYENELEFLLNNGIITESTSFYNYKTHQSICATNQDSLVTFIFSHVNWELIPTTQEPYIIIDFSANEKGQIDSVSTSSEWSKSFQNEIKRVFHLIPEWSIYYEKEHFIRVNRSLVLFFNERLKNQYQLR